MSEEILKALTQLFAIVTKQDGGVTANERELVISFFRQELDQTSVAAYTELYDQFSGYHQQTGDGTNEKTSVRDSVQTLGICKKINRTLTRKQKVVVVMKLLDLVAADRDFTVQRMEIVQTAATVFNIRPHEYELAQAFVKAESPADLNFREMVLATPAPAAEAPQARHLHAHLEGLLVFLHIQSEDLYFVRYTGEETVWLNSLPMLPHRAYLFAPGSTLRTQEGSTVYYSDLVSFFREEIRTARLSFEAHITRHQFARNVTALHEIKLQAGPGQLIGIMGASGAGKTTLLNVLAGLDRPTQGEIKINGFDVYGDRDKIQGVIGYVSQDDLLIEELTVYENIYFNTRLCFDHLSKQETDARVMSMLTDLGLDQRKDLVVGNPLNKKISGGQRKRLNIALELIRQPAVLFLDEPTSGLSSRDSENVIDLLKQLALKGKLVFAVIHQPSSDVFKLFDKIIVMDTGGYPVYIGPPVEAVTYFKKATHQVDSNRGQCETCGNVNPEQIFNILEASVVDEYGQPTARRKITPAQWNEMFRKKYRSVPLEPIRETPPASIRLPHPLKQAFLFAWRDCKAKISNRQYMLINLLEAPILAFFLAFIIRYRSAPSGLTYSFRFNENIPAYLLMAIIVALFMGLTVSAEEIIHDRKILKRESFLNLSWNSYLLSKVTILFTLSAIQTLSFVWVGNALLEIEGMTLGFWLILWASSCFANVLGLLISSAFHSAVTVYVLIPLLLIPQMVLSGILFSFDKVNHALSNKAYVPVVADLMTARWAYEAMAVYQFRHNAYQAPFYEYEQREAEADFKAVHLTDALRGRLQVLRDHLRYPSDSSSRQIAHQLQVFKNTLQTEPYRLGLEEWNSDEDWMPATFTEAKATQLQTYLQLFQSHYQKEFNHYGNLADRKRSFYESKGISINNLKNRHYNEQMADLVKNANVKDRVEEYAGRLIATVNPIYQQPQPRHLFDYRTFFFVPEKHFLGIFLPTYVFNIFLIIFMTAFLYWVLYLKFAERLGAAVEQWARRILKR